MRKEQELRGAGLCNGSRATAGMLRKGWRTAQVGRAGAGTRRWAGRVALSPAGALEQPTPLGIGVLSCALDFWWLGRFSAGSHWRGWPCPLEHTSSPPCRCFSRVRRGRRTGLHLRVLLEIWTPALGVPWILAWLPSSGQHPCFTSLSQNRAHCKKCNLSPFALLNALY